jgi:hypothetical protein
MNYGLRMGKIIKPFAKVLGASDSIEKYYQKLTCLSHFETIISSTSNISEEF